MSSRNDQQFIHAQIITSFLQGDTIRFAMTLSNMTSAEIYVVLQRRFRHVPDLERAILVKEQEMTACRQKLRGAEAEIQDLRAALRAKDEEISAYTERLKETEGALRGFTEQHEHQEFERKEFIHNILLANEALEQKDAQQEEEIEILRSQLAMRRWPRSLIDTELTDVPGTGRQPTFPTRLPEKQVLNMFYQTDSLSEVCSATGLKEDDIFRIVRSRFGPPGPGLLRGIELPTHWQVETETLTETVRGSSFLFSMAVVDTFFGCRTVRDLVKLLTVALQDFSHFLEPEWQFMAAFLVEMAFKGVVREKTTVANLEEKIAELKSLRGRLTRKCRSVKEVYERKSFAYRLEACRLRRQLNKQEEAMQARPTMDAPREPERLDVLAEMIETAKKGGAKRYSSHLYYTAVVVMFRSRSTYEFMRQFLPLPAPNSIYEHFRDSVHASLARLKSIDQVESYLKAQIALHPEIAAGAVLAVDAVSCSSTFIGMKAIERCDTRYLFVVNLQPIAPIAKCFPLFVIRSNSGIGDEALQKKITEVVTIAQGVIARVFIASDGDSSFNDRHHSFFDFWDELYRNFGLERVLEELKAYPEEIPLGDLLHLGKNFRTRFLLFLLTFMRELQQTTIDHDKIRAILGLGAPLTDLTPLGKMRDIYPLVLTRFENIVALIENGAIAEAVALLPLSVSFNAVRLETITRVTRTDLLRISFFIVRKLYEFKQTGLDTNPETTSKAENRLITIFTSQWCLRFMDTVLALIVAVEEYDEVALDRVSTHPLENFFGLVRKDANDINTPDEMERTIAHTDIVKEAHRDLGIEEPVRKRVNVGGVHVDSRHPHAKVFEVEMPEGLDHARIAEICLKAVHAQHGLLSEEEQCGFLQVCEYLKALAHAAAASATDKEINHRIIAGSGGQIRTHLVSH
jgi:hypothetical protein